MKANQQRRVAVVTGTRAEYGLLKTVMRAIKRHPALRLEVVACGMHFLRKFGYTIKDIEADGWPIDARVRMQSGRSDDQDQGTGLAKGVAGISRYLCAAKTDVVVVLGDRIEAMAGALAAVTTGRILAQIHGGDTAPGDSDEGLRHAITKLAHIHLAATAEARGRIIRMGEQPKCVFNVGAPGLDDLVDLLKSECSNGRPNKEGALVIQHAYGRSAEKECRTMASALRAVEHAGLKPTIIYPNSDRGHAGVVDAIEQYQAAHPDVLVHRSLPREKYLQLLAWSRVLVGNSSSGIIESASAGTAAVNVGGRQEGRQHSGPSVIDCKESTKDIERAIGRALLKRPKIGGTTCYGQGKAGQRIADILARTKLDETLRRKRISY